MPPRGRARGDAAATTKRGRSSNRAAAQPQPPPVQEQSSETFPATPDTTDEEAPVNIPRDRSRSPVPVLISPIKRRARLAAPAINKQTDLDVWGMSDSEILSR